MSHPKTMRGKARVALTAIAGAGLVLGLAGAPAAAADDGWERWLDNEHYKVHLNVRSRMELANFNGLDSSQAYTVRTRLGIETRPFYGFSAMVEGENIFSFDDSQYFTFQLDF